MGDGGELGAAAGPGLHRAGRQPGRRRRHAAGRDPRPGGPARHAPRRPSRGCMPPIRSGSPTSPSSGTRWPPSTCRPGRTRRPGPRSCWSALKAIEVAFGRQARRRWGPRELDLDLLVFGRARLAIDRPRGRPLGGRRDRSRTRRPDCWSCPIPRWPSGCSCWPRWPTWPTGLVPPGWGETRRHGPPPARDRRRTGGGPADRDLGPRRREPGATAGSRDSG